MLALFHEFISILAPDFSMVAFLYSVARNLLTISSYTLLYDPVRAFLDMKQDILEDGQLFQSFPWKDKFYPVIKEHKA